MEPINRVRRRNREVTDERWIEAFLERAKTCVVGTSGDSRVFLIPNLFLFDREHRVVYFHTAGSGRTRTNIEREPAVTLCMYELGDLVTGSRATDFSVRYASVVIFGRASIVTDPAEVRRVMTTQMKKYAPEHEAGRDFIDFTDEEAAHATVYRVEIESWSAKENADPGHAG